MLRATAAIVNSGLHAAWLLDRNTFNVKADWRFTAADARIKLKSLCPAL
jgi:hypothetical protein